MTTPTPATPPAPPVPAVPPPEKPKKEAPPVYVCPLGDYLAEVRRIAFGEGARWARSNPPGADIEVAARAFASQPVR